MVKRKAFGAPKKKKVTITIKKREPEEVTDMKRLVKGFPSAFLSGRATHFLSTRKDLAERGDWFFIEETKFFFTSNRAAISVGLAAETMFQLLGYLSKADFIAGTKAVMVEYTPSKKLWLWSFAPAIDYEHDAIHDCTFMPPGMRIRRDDKKSMFFLEVESDGWGGVPVKNCPGCRAVLTAVIE